MERNGEMIQKLKDVKSILVSKELRGDDWDDMQAAVSRLEEVVSYINDCSGKGLSSKFTQCAGSVTANDF